MNGSRGDLDLVQLLVHAVEALAHLVVKSEAEILHVGLIVVGHMPTIPGRKPGGGTAAGVCRDLLRDGGAGADAQIGLGLVLALIDVRSVGVVGGVAVCDSPRSDGAALA